MNLAQSEAGQPESTATQIQSTTKPSTGTNPQPTQSQGSSGKSSNTGAIAGGVVGGILALLIIVGLLFFFLRKKPQPASAQYSAGGGLAYVNGVVEPNMAQQPYYTSPSPFGGTATTASHNPLIPGPGTEGQRLYVRCLSPSFSPCVEADDGLIVQDPNDPTTFPSSPAPASSISPSYNPAQPYNPTSSPAGQGHGAYHGIAEI